VRLDPFRLQILTISLDSHIVLTLVGLIVAGLVVGRAAREHGHDLSASDWWDLVVASVIGGRLLWVMTHPDYYLRQPLQVIGLLDGGLHLLGLALGAAYWVWRRSRGGDLRSWRPVVDVVAVGVLVVLLFERVGCTLTTCGTGYARDVPWAILRGDTLHEPMALGQVAILAVALVASTEILRIRGAAFAALLAAVALSELVGFAAGRVSVESLLAIGAFAALYRAALTSLVAAPDASLSETASPAPTPPEPATAEHRPPH